MDKPLIFILSWERPLYLWACLDSLRRTTTTPCRFVLLDNASIDPLVHRVIASFEARDMFHRVYRRSENSPMALTEAVQEHEAELGDHFVFIENDVLVLPSQPSWLEEFQDLCVADPKLAMLGSLVDKSDFIDPQWAAKHFSDISVDQLEFLTKSKSKERTLADHYEERIIDPFNPPGRFLYLKSEAFLQTGDMPDYWMSQAMKDRGYSCGIATRVRHRHLSLSNAFDYPDYDLADRKAFFKKMMHGKR